MAAGAAAAQDAPPGARPAGLGRAYSALADDAHAPFWNPAGLGILRSPQAALLGGAGKAGGTGNAAALAVPVGERAGAGALLDVSPGLVSYGAAAGFALTPGTALGASARRVDGAASGAAADLAAFFRLDRRLSAAAVAANLGGRPRALDGAFAPPQARLGAAYSAPRFTYALEGVFDRLGAAGVRSGAEVILFRTFSARLGVDTTVEGSPAVGLTAGVGLTFGAASLDAAVIPRNAGPLGRLSLVMKLGRGERAVAAAPEPPPAPAPARRAARRTKDEAVRVRLEAGASYPEPEPSRSGFIAEPPQPDWEKPRAPAPAEKPVVEEPSHPGLIWLGQ